MTGFDQFGLHPDLLKALQNMGYDAPTPVQKETIPLALEGKDILGSAQTGTGKTGAFSIPLVEKMLRYPRGSALVLTPTRELGKQVLDIITQLLKNKPSIKTAFLIGGESMPKQIQQLRMRPRVIVGTPGRIEDLLVRGDMMLHDTGFLVLDETDRMLDLGFADQLKTIMKYLPDRRQTLLFSATLPKNITKLSQQYLTFPERVAIGSTENTADNLTQKVVYLPAAKKATELTAQLKEREGTVIVFVNTKKGCDQLAQKLKGKAFAAEAIHCDLRQSERHQVLESFRDNKYRVLVATDVAARGLDIPHIAHVINYDLPQAPEDYIHRIGRTARAGAEGQALCLISANDEEKWEAIRKLLDENVKMEIVGQPVGGKENSQSNGDKTTSKPKSRRPRKKAPKES